MKLITNVFLMIIIMTSFSHCSSAQKLQKEAPVTIGKVYYQHWVAGIQSGGSGVNLFIPVKESLTEDVQLDSVFFKGKVSKLEVKPTNPNLFIGRFSTSGNQKKDIIMSDKPNAEYVNEGPKKKPKIPFELKENECVVSYIEANKTKYFKVENIIEKQPQLYPSAPPKKH